MAKAPKTRNEGSKAELAMDAKAARSKGIPVGKYEGSRADLKADAPRPVPVKAKPKAPNKGR